MRRFTEDPASARIRPSVTATLANGHARISAGPFNWESDLPAPVGGTNHAPSPTAYLLGALAGCAVVFVHDTLAPEFGVEIDALTATAQCGADLAGLLGMAGTTPELTDMALDIHLETSSDPSRVEALLQAWQERCPIYLALLKPAQINLSFS